MEFNTEIKLYVSRADVRANYYNHNSPCAVDLALKNAGYPHITNNGMGLNNNQTNQWIKPKNIHNYFKLIKRIKLEEQRINKTYKGSNPTPIKNNIELILKLNL